MLVSEGVPEVLSQSESPEMDAIFTKVGGYVLGNVITSFIAGAGTFLWMLAWGIPYPALLGLLIWWVSQDFPHGPDWMARTYEALAHPGLRATAEMP